MPERRKDYARNIRARVQKGCTWCGTEMPPPVTTASYCSDACVQADHEGIDDLPPVVLAAWSGAQASEEYVSRTIERMNASYNDWAESRSSAR